MSRLLGTTLLGLLVTAQGALAQSTDETVIARAARTEFNYASWSGTRGTDLRDAVSGRGQQLYSSAIGDVVAERAGKLRFEADVRMGHVLSQHHAGGVNANYAGFLDTQLAATLTLLQSTDFRPFIGIAANLPTGRSALPLEKRLTRMDGDLVAVSSYGEGTNFNPSAGVTFAPFRNFTIAPSLGYAFRGKFEQEASNGLFLSNSLRVQAPQERTTMTPGDMLTASTTAAYQAETWNSTAVFAFLDQTAMKVNDTPVAKQGVRYALNANANFILTGALTLRLGGSWSFAEKNAYGADGTLVKEGLNSKSQLLTASVRPAFNLGAVTVGPQYSILYRDHNAYSIVDAQFLSAKTKHAAGFFIEGSVRSDLTYALDVSKFWIQEKAGSGATDATFSPIPLSYSGYSAILSANLKF